MSYQNPIDIIMHDMQMKTEDEICKAVQKVGIYVDKDELMRALQYDRKQYQKGYDDRDAEIVRCKDCEYYTEPDSHGDRCDKIHWSRGADWYCADGVKKDD